MSDNSPISIIKLTLPMFIGSTLNWLLFGILIVQVYIYFSAFPKDPALSKYIVVTVVVLEVVETLSSAHDMIHTFGTGWGSMEALDDVGWAWFSVPVMGAVVACVGQLFFARRILIFSHNKYVTVLIIILAILQLGAGIWTGVIISLAKRFSLLQFDNLVATATWLAATAACDLVIVFGTVFYLAKSRRPEFKKTNGVISRIIMITVETGLLCALLAIFDLYLFVTYKGTNYHLALCIELSKVYSNSILMVSHTTSSTLII
ncbi:hypothetical protein DFH09DRAFT_1299468 [Mycena vulgaris]|nr:hypothetical protein DFH09DRAFT_1299468 [Mycena vulgaris]